MSCCLPPPEFVEAVAGPVQRGPSANEAQLASRDLGGGIRQSDFAVPAIHCGACINTIEQALGQIPRVQSARVNLSTKRVSVRWTGDTIPSVVDAMVRLGYEPHLYEAADEQKDQTLPALIRALAVAAFASMNIMMLSGSVWSGADGPTRDILHWICAGLTLPALLYSGRTFYASAWQAMTHGRTNMDVPITIGIILAFALSLHDTIRSGEQVYFDATVSLLFFLLIGRTLDHVMRERARMAVRGLAQLSPRGVLVQQEDGTCEYLPLRDIAPGMIVLLVPGERVPVDALVIEGSSDLDRSLLSGESTPDPVQPGTRVEAGTLNLTGSLTLQVEASEQESTLAQMIRLLEGAENGRASYRRIADRAAELYSPVVHLSAAAAFVGWMLFDGDLHNAATIAIAVLIITCPCALGLAVPMVQVVAARRLFDAGIMMKDGSALERLAEVDTAIFDKTGTLTEGTSELANRTTIPAEIMALAASIAQGSQHPYSRAIMRAASGAGDHRARSWESLEEVPGLGVEAREGGSIYRLGRAGWALSEPGQTGTVLTRDGALLAGFEFAERLRPGAAQAVATLKTDGVLLEIVSGDQPKAVQQVADKLGIHDTLAGALPADKCERLKAITNAGHRPLMVGDGLNDAPALLGAHVSMAPANAADVGRNAADFVFLRSDLLAVPMALRIAREASALVKQNLALSLLYNAIALPAAVAGLINPFVAAIAMSLSSVVVVLNALRLGFRRPELAPLERSSEANL